MTVSRRSFLKESLLAGAALALQPAWTAQAKSAPRIPVSLQLYSVRQDCGRDFDRALEAVARLGYDGVEFAGYYQYNGKAAELKHKLDGLGLRGIATHIDTNHFRGDRLQQTIAFHQTLGCKYLIVPGDGDFTHPEKSKALAELFNKTAEVLKPLGLYCGYHNHTHEFKKDGDKTYFDLFAERTSPDVVLQQDVGWTAAAGLDPVTLIKRYPGRFRIMHFKPTVLGGAKDKQPILGQDSIDWAQVLAAGRTKGRLEWITIEQEACPPGQSPMECSGLSLAGLKKLL